MRFSSCNPSLDPAEVEDVIVGAANHEGEQGGNIARLGVILSKLPVTTAAQSINRFVPRASSPSPLRLRKLPAGRRKWLWPAE